MEHTEAVRESSQVFTVAPGVWGRCDVFVNYYFIYGLSTRGTRESAYMCLTPRVEIGHQIHHSVCLGVATVALLIASEIELPATDASVCFGQVEY